MQTRTLMISMLVGGLLLGAVATVAVLAVTDSSARGITNVFAPESALLTPALLFGLLLIVAVTIIAFTAAQRRRRSLDPAADEHDEPLTSVADRERDGHIHSPR